MGFVHYTQAGTKDRGNSMGVYVDDMRAHFRGMIMCHMIADTPLELFGMAKRIGLKPKWVQGGGTYREHFDVSLGKRALAIQAGATEITQRRLGELLNERREVHGS